MDTNLSASSKSTVVDDTQKLIDAARDGDGKTVEALLSGGARIDGQDDLGCTALFEAVSGEHHGVVKLLLDWGANPDVSENNGATALMEAASGGDITILRLLIEHGASVQKCDDFGDSAIDYAVAQQQHSCAQLLQNSELG